MDSLVSIKNVCEDDFSVEFDIIPVVNPNEIKDERRKKIREGLENVEAEIEITQQRINELNDEIDRLTNHADGFDYAIAVTCGILTGIFDSVFVGEWNFADAKAVSNREINEKVSAFAQKDPDFQRYCQYTKDGKLRKNPKDPNRLDSAISFLEEKYPLPGDGAYKEYKSLGITDATHHLDDFCHHPTLIGLVCSILVQFTGTATYRSSTGNVINVPVEVNQYGKFVGNQPWSKLFAGIINWFFNIVQTGNNWKGHLMSDMAGSSTAAGKGNSGAGIPGSFMSTAKELASLPCFKDSNFAENLRKAYQNGIGTGAKQVDLGPFNSLFEGASSKVDLRTEMAVQHELKRQAVPVIINEVLVRGLYFIRRFISQMKDKKSILELNWKEVLPFRNRTIVRMVTIASGTFTAIDMADAAIHSAIKSGGFSSPAFLSNMILRVNFVGVGRFAVAVGTDVGMGIKRNMVRNERIKLYEKQIAWTNVKIFYKEADMWIAAESAGETINKAFNKMDETTIYFKESMNEMEENFKKMTQYISGIEEKNRGLSQELDEIIIWG